MCSSSSITSPKHVPGTFSERPGGFGKRDLYVTTRARLRGPDVADNDRDETHQREKGKEQK